jgi:predicted RNA-binding protein associated with RNAse of E/G family
LRKNLIASGAVAGALLLGSAGAALVLPSLVAAADPTASPAASPTASGAPSAQDGRHGPGGFGGTTEAVSDASVVAKAIGITETELNTALSGGQSIAAVAKAHNVDVQTVVDALVADKKDEIAAALKAGTITQAQADQESANATKFATDQVNGTGFGRGGRGGGHGFGGGPNEAVSDTSVAAKAIGISESDLTTALQGGQSIAAVAKAHNVDAQTVVDALVADGKSELAAAVKAGTITQAQADQEAANLTARVTAQVNGTGFGPGGHGPGGRPNDNDADDSPSASPSTGTGTSG